MITETTALLEQRKVALIAGITLIIMTIAAGFSYGYVHTNILHGDVLQNLSSKSLLFKAEIVGWLVIFVTDIIVA